MAVNGLEYLEYLVVESNDHDVKTRGYFCEYKDAVKILQDTKDGKLFGSHYVPTTISGLLQKVWSEIKINTGS